MPRERDHTPPAGPGAYVLLIELSRPLPLPIARLSWPTLAPGRYLYCGSARGPGGLAARVGRHLRAAKRPHWHVDHLTLNGRILDVIYRLDISECRLHDCLAAQVGMTTPIAGFGSSDCRNCPSHLLRAPKSFVFSHRHMS